jgi:hypothetical protein
VLVQFGDSLLEDASVSVWDASTELRFLLSFITPSVAPGSYAVSIKPKTCSEQCEYQVTFDFLVIDGTLPSLLEPVPSRGALQEAEMAQLAIGRVDTANLLQVTATYIMADTSSEVGAISSVPFVVDPGRDGVITLFVPHLSDATSGDYVVRLLLTTSFGTNAISFNYEIYNGTEVGASGEDAALPPGELTIGGCRCGLSLSAPIRLPRARPCTAPQLGSGRRFQWWSPTSLRALLRAMCWCCSTPSRSRTF